MAEKLPDVDPGTSGFGGGRAIHWAMDVPPRASDLWTRTRNESRLKLSQSQILVEGLERRKEKRIKRQRKKLDRQELKQNLKMNFDSKLKMTRTQSQSQN